MGGSVIFYTYGSTLELNGQQLTAGMLTADLLNLSPDEYMRLKKRMTQITDLAEEYERKRDVALWWKLNEELAEYQESKSLEELADLLEVMQAVVKARGWTLEELEQVRVEKAAKRGGFEKKILLKEVQG